MGRGSPPQVRGKLLLVILALPLLRITPAGAGKTASTGTNLAAKRDHPRRCGENSAIAVSIHRTLGSPPQVRGKPTVPHVTHAAQRITPAGAGKTSLR